MQHIRMLLAEFIISILLLIITLTLTPFLHFKPFLSFQPWDMLSTLLLTLLFLPLFRAYPLLEFALSLGTLILASSLLKIILHVPRPLPVLPDYGMPSQHALLAAFAFTLHSRLNAWLILAFLLILSIRLGTGAHSLLDVTVGSLLGWQAGLLIKTVWEKRGDAYA